VVRWFATSILEKNAKHSIEMKKILIIGAGPAGLSAAYELAKKGFSVEVLEAAAEVGGMARTLTLWGHKVDLGPHRFFTTNEKVTRLWHEMVGDEFAWVERKTRVLYDGKFFSYPLKPWEALRKLGVTEALRCVGSYLGTRPKGRPASFEEWVSQRFGRRLFEIFFKSYSEKLWGLPCAELDPEFAEQRIRKFSLAEALAPTQRHKTLVDTFAYPLQGTGAVYRTMANRVQALGGKIRLGCPVQSVLVDGGRVTGVALKDGERLLGDHVISTMPITSLLEALVTVPEAIRERASRLQFRNTLLVYLNVSRTDLFPDNWIYVHSAGLRTGRITNFRNWVPSLCGSQASTVVCLEYWAQSEDPLWAKSREELVAIAKKELRETGLDGGAEVLDGTVVRLARSYPIYRRGYRKDLDPVMQYLNSYRGLSLIGRYGSFKYNNQDHSLLMGILAAENISEGARHDLTAVNSDCDYQEAGHFPPSKLAGTSVASTSA